MRKRHTSILMELRSTAVPVCLKVEMKDSANEPLLETSSVEQPPNAARVDNGVEKRIGHKEMYIRLQYPLWGTVRGAWEGRPETPRAHLFPDLGGTPRRSSGR